MFSTKAEYGVRVMVELARRSGEEPVPLAEIAPTTACRWPTWSTSSRACARPAWLTRGAARAAATCWRARPSRSRWPRSSRRWRGRSRRSSASRRRPTARSCARASPIPGHVCPTKLLWTRVRFAIVRTLQETTLADLVLEPALAARSAGRRPRAARELRRSAAALRDPDRWPAGPDGRMADLEIRDLHVSHDEHEILKGVDLDISRGEIHALMGPNGSGKSTLASTLMGHPAYEITEGSITFRGEDITEAEPHERAKAGLFLAFQYPVSIPGVSVANFLRMAINAKREEPIGVKEFRTELAARGRPAGRRQLVHLAPPQRRLLGRREEARRDPADGDAAARHRGARRDRLGPRHRRAAHGRRGRAAAARRAGPGRADHHPLPAHPALRRTPSSCTSCWTGASCSRAASSWSSASSARAMTRSASSSAPARRASWRPVTAVRERGASSAGGQARANGSQGATDAPKAKPGRHREATLYHALAGAGAGDRAHARAAARGGARGGLRGPRAAGVAPLGLLDDEPAEPRPGRAVGGARRTRRRACPRWSRARCPSAPARGGSCSNGATVAHVELTPSSPRAA